MSPGLLRMHMPYKIILLAVFLSIWVVPVLAVGSFITPASNNGPLILGEQFEIEWRGTADYSMLSLGFYSNTNATITWLISNTLNYPTTYLWVVRPDIEGFANWRTDTFRLYIVNGTEFGAPFVSPNFFIQSQASTSASSTVPTSSAVPASSTVPAGSTVPVSSTSSTPLPAASGNGLSPGAQAGIGVGVACVALGAALACWFWWRHRRGNRSVGAPEVYHPTYSSGTGVSHAGMAEIYSKTPMTPVEIPATSTVEPSVIHEAEATTAFVDERKYRAELDG